MEDFLYRGHLNDQAIRFSYALTTNLSNVAVKQHDCGPITAHVLTRALNASLLTVPLLEEEEFYSFKWHYPEGQLKTVMAEVTAKSHVRGFVSPSLLAHEFEGEDKTALFGEKCQLKVMKFDGPKVRNSGIAESIFQDPVADLAYFFSYSDQIETEMLCLVALNPDPECPIRICQGFMIQAMPDCDLEQFDAWRQNLAGEVCRELLAREPLADNHSERILQGILGMEDLPDGLHLHACEVPQFSCHCSRERMMQGIKTLGPEDRQDILEKNDPLNLRCHFCNELYEISIDECRKLFSE